MPLRWFPLKDRSSTALLLFLFLFVDLGLSQRATNSIPTSANSDRKYAPGRVLVKFRQGTTAQARADLHASLGAKTAKQFSAVANLEAVFLPANLDVPSALRAYRQRPDVEYAEPDYIVHLLNTPDDPLFSQMWNLLNTGQNGGTVGDDIGATLAWNLTTGDHSVVVATIDTGIDFTHPDLVPNLFHDTSVCNGVNDATNRRWSSCPVSSAIPHVRVLADSRCCRPEWL